MSKTSAHQPFETGETLLQLMFAPTSKPNEVIPQGDTKAEIVALPACRQALVKSGYIVGYFDHYSAMNKSWEPRRPVEKLVAGLTTHDDANRSQITSSCELGPKYLYCRLLSN